MIEGDKHKGIITKANFHVVKNISTWVSIALLSLTIPMFIVLGRNSATLNFNDLSGINLDMFIIATVILGVGLAVGFVSIIIDS